jgi:predicted DCC family thiol-disulfide oxidoreductase YuxK
MGRLPVLRENERVHLNLAMTPIHREAYSYRAETSVPHFDDTGPVVFMDGECALCSRTARMIARLDRRGEFRICPVQSELGRAVLRHYGLDSDSPDSWIYLANGKAYTSLDAVIAAGTRLGGVAQLVRIFLILPRSARDWLYRRIARNRYAIFGREQICAIPDAALRQRLLS